MRDSAAVSLDGSDAAVGATDAPADAPTDAMDPPADTTDSPVDSPDSAAETSDSWEDEPSDADTAEDAVTQLTQPTVRIDLLWSAPGEPPVGDSGPSAGPDLDLHLLHPNVNNPECDPDGDGVLANSCGCDVDGDGLDDGLFEAPWDCFWFDPSPDWGATGPLNDPLHGSGASEETGPETIILQQPEEGATYRIAVHGWGGSAAALATVRVYITGWLVFEMSDVPLDVGEVWHVATLSWPSGEVVPFLSLDGDPHISPAPNGFCFQP